MIDGSHLSDVWIIKW